MMATANYRVGQHVGFVAPRRVEVSIPNRWYILRCAPGRDGKVIERAHMLDVCACSLVLVRHVDRRTGREAARPHLGRRVVSPFLPGLIFIPDFDANNPALGRLEFVEGWLQITKAGATVAAVRPARRFEIADRHGRSVLPSRAVASLSVDEMAALRAIVDAENAPRVGRGRRGGSRRLAVDQSVYVADGPFSGFAAKIERLDSNGRLKAFIAALMGGVSVELSETQVEPV